MYACYCLNILIETQDNDFEKVALESLHLNEEEIKDKFFQQDLRRIGKLVNINKIQPVLVQMRTIGNWNIYCCFNCTWETYAVHKEKGASCVLVSSQLRDSKSIKSVREQNLLSKVYNIIVNTGDNNENDTALNLYQHCDTDLVLRNIRMSMVDFINMETSATEDRVKKYAETQYELLNNLRDAAYEEHNVLVRIIQRLREQTNPASTNTPIEPSVMQSSVRRPDQTFSSPLLGASAENTVTSLRHSPKRQKSSPAAVQKSSIDAEGLFDFESSDGLESVPESADEVESSDKEDLKEDGISIPRGKASKLSIAKSLPMNIPAFMHPSKNQSTEDLDEIPQEENLDIAASIKALAKSVHGDAVFGELPRPRFSTQI